MFHGSIRAGLFRRLRSRHPLARVFAGAFGILALVLLVALGMFAVAALVIGGGLVLLVNAFRSRNAPHPRANAAPGETSGPGVIEGEFTVLPNPAATHDETRSSH